MLKPSRLIFFLVKSLYKILNILIGYFRYLCPPRSGIWTCDTLSRSKRADHWTQPCPNFFSPDRRWCSSTSRCLGRTSARQSFRKAAKASFLTFSLQAKSDRNEIFSLLGFAFIIENCCLHIFAQVPFDKEWVGREQCDYIWLIERLWWQIFLQM